MTAMPPRLNKLGQTYRNFKLVKVKEIPELQCLLRELVHEPSGARILHIANDDPENLFCLSFQTLPDNSNGAAHILEHTVLCGSEKFPVKDPFFSMGRRSLNTYMNALTGADFTCYPASSQVPKDFYNLLAVYIDAVFHPNLNELSFAQEGHRLEFSTPNDPSTPLEYKGIVYNEMKGALSSSSARLAEAINETLFPDVTYGFNSGGDPTVIPTLTYDQLKDFHKKYYHPGRCLFYFYGNLPLEGHLDFIEENALKGVEKVPPLPPIPLQPRFQKPVHKIYSYPIAPDESPYGKTLLAFGWLTCHILEQEDVLAMNIIEILLLDTDASPLKMALLKSGLCKQVNSFIDIEINEIPWGIILKGCNTEHADTLEALIRQTLFEISEKPISVQTIENAIHQLEIYRSEILGDHAPFGLSLFMRSGLLEQHGAEPEQGLVIHSLFEQLRKKALANSLYFNELIKKYLIDNTHFVRIAMQPDQSLGLMEAEQERSRLQAIKESLTIEAKQHLVQRAEELSAFQKKQEEENVDVLPKVSLKDVPLTSRPYELTKEPAGPLTLFHHAVFTNDIIYADLVYDLPKLSEEELYHLRLLSVILTQVGSGERGYEENLDYIQGNTGGIGAGISLNLQANDSHCFQPTFHLRGKALHRKAPKLFHLMKDTLTAPHLDGLKRFKEIILKHFTAME
ncbi:MAG: insulinase family protein, partial [Parachlamydia sp.]|nr:insulinase family protein [Parachlamydia sp.]